MTASTLGMLGVLLIFVGFAIVFLAVLLLLFRSAKGTSKVRGGGVVLIGPFPIVFGTDRESVKLLLILSIVLVVTVFFVMFALHYVFGSGGI